MHNALKSTADSIGVGEKGKKRKKEGRETEDSRKRKRSALEEIREVNTHSQSVTCTPYVNYDIVYYA